MSKLAEMKAALVGKLSDTTDKALNIPVNLQKFLVNPQAFTELITGKNPMPKETGFAAGATGLPAKEGSVMDTNYRAYTEGYERGEPVSYAAMAAPFAAPAAVATAKALGPKAGQMAEMYMMQQGMMPGIIKQEKGGNWLPGNIRPGQHWTPEDQLAETLGFNTNDPALKNWVETQLTRYVKNEMGSPDDSIRKLADEGILHYTPRRAYNEHNNQPTNLQREAEIKRTYAGTPEGESALTQLGKDWETNVDAGITSKTIGPKTIEKYGEDFSWLKNAEGKKLQTIDDEFLYSHLGFDHMVDVLREQIASGVLRPESLKSLSVPQAVQRTHEYNLAKEKAMQKIKLQADSEMPVTKDYPEQGYKWLQLKHPTDPKVTEKALKYEGDAMGHCVGGYCPDVEAGSTKIYSLRDAKGEPHVTIEVNPGKHPIGYGVSGDEDFPKSFRYEDSDMNDIALPKEQYDAIYNRAREIFDSKGNVRNAADARYDSFQQAANEVLGERPGIIQQIKGKQNAAPKDEYKSFVQDFVKSGNWENVKDLQNTGLIPTSNLDSLADIYPKKESLQDLHRTSRLSILNRAVREGENFPKYITREDYEDILEKYARPDPWNPSLRK